MENNELQLSDVFYSKREYSIQIFIIHPIHFSFVRLLAILGKVYRKAFVSENVRNFVSRKKALGRATCSCGGEDSPYHMILDSVVNLFYNFKFL